MSTERTSFTRAVRDYLTARPMTWVHAGTLQQIGGAFASRTRISNARKQLEREGLGTITNTTERVYSRGACVRVDSFYRYEPSVEALPAMGHDVNAEWRLR